MAVKKSETRNDNNSSESWKMLVQPWRFGSSCLSKALLYLERQGEGEKWYLNLFVYFMVDAYDNPSKPSPVVPYQTPNPCFYMLRSQHRARFSEPMSEPPLLLLLRAPWLTETSDSELGKMLQFIHMDNRISSNFLYSCFCNS